MKRQTTIILALVIFSVLAPLCLAQAAPPLARYIVHTNGDPAVNEAARQGVVDHGGHTLKELPTGNGSVVLIPAVAAGNIKKIVGVTTVEPDLIVKAVNGQPEVEKTAKPARPPKDDPQPEQPPQGMPWGVDRIDADLAWGTVVGANIGIAIIDTGIDKDHPDLSANLAGGRNFTGKIRGRVRKVDPDAWDDDSGHGSHVAGIASALNNDIGSVGVAPAASLFGVKVLDESGSGYLSDVVDGIYWAAGNELVSVINLSLGIEKEILDQYPADKQLLKDAVDYAYNQGVIVVGAAGNEGNSAGTGDNVIYPARFDSVIAVAATGSNDQRASFSSTGPSVELAGPGVDIYSTWYKGLYNTIPGTSMASPHVAGAAALVVANIANLGDLDGDGWVNQVDVRLKLRETADDLGTVGNDELFGYGLVDAQEAATGIETLP